MPCVLSGPQSVERFDNFGICCACASLCVRVCEKAREERETEREGLTLFPLSPPIIRESRAEEGGAEAPCL